MTDDPALPRYYTAAELAEMLQVTPEFIYDQCRARRWPHLRLGKLVRFTPGHLREIEDLIEVRPALQQTSRAAALARNREAKRLLGGQ